MKQIKKFFVRTILTVLWIVWFAEMLALCATEHYVIGLSMLFAPGLFVGILVALVEKGIIRYRQN